MKASSLALGIVLQICVLARVGLAFAPPVLAFGVSRTSNDENNNNNSKGIYTPAPGSLTGQSFLITGGTTGIGLETAKRLTIGNPANLIITARSDVKGREAVQAIQSYQKQQSATDAANTNISYKLLDLDNLQGIRDAVAAWLKDDDFPA